MASQNFINGAQLAGARGEFVSAPTVATGALQLIPHGLGRTPTRIAVKPVIGSNGAGGAGVELPAAAITTAPDATNCNVTCPGAWTGGSFVVKAF